MMYFPPTFMMNSLDPIENQRLADNRPASRMEITQRVLRERRNEVGDVQIGIDKTSVRSRFSSEKSSGPMERFRHSISRVLNSAADRIAPEAA